MVRQLLYCASPLAMDNQSETLDPHRGRDHHHHKYATLSCRRLSTVVRTYAAVKKNGCGQNRGAPFHCPLTVHAHVSIPSLLCSLVDYKKCTCTYTCTCTCTYTCNIHVMFCVPASFLSCALFRFLVGGEVFCSDQSFCRTVGASLTGFVLEGACLPLTPPPRLPRYQNPV